MPNEEKKWLLADANFNEYGPFTSIELEQKYSLGEINGDTLCSRKTLFDLVSGWEPLRTHFPEFKGNTEWPLRGSVAGDQYASVQVPFESGTTDSGGTRSNSQDELARLLRVVIANQERQITSLKGIHWGIAAFAVLLLSRLFYN